MLLKRGRTINSIKPVCDLAKDPESFSLSINAEMGRSKIFSISPCLKIFYKGGESSNDKKNILKGYEICKSFFFLNIKPIKLFYDTLCPLYMDSMWF